MHLLTYALSNCSGFRDGLCCLIDAAETLMSASAWISVEATQ